MRGAAVTRTSFDLLLCRAGARKCALPLASVVEIMRRLPVRTLGFGPAFVEGLAVVRGAPVPVVNLGRLLGDERSLAAVRFVSVKLDTRAAVLGVDAVVGTRALDQSALDALPPLLREAQQQTVETLSTLDNELLIVLAGARLLPEAFWEEWGRRGANA